MTKGLAVIYDRASTQKQSENYTRQDVKRIGEEIARRYDYETESEPRFEIKSGEDLQNRLVMLAILNDIAAGKTASGQKILAIIVPNFTRLSRDEDIIDGLVIKKTCRDNGVVVIDFNGKVYNFENDNDQDTALLEFWFASRDKRQMMNTMMRGAKERAMQGKYMGGPPSLGYILVPSGEVNRRRKSLYKLAIDSKEAELVRSIFQLYMNHSAEAVASTLNVKGIALPPKHKGRKGGFVPRSFTGTDIMRIVTSPIYAGWVRWAVVNRKNRPRSKYLKDFEPQVHFDPTLQIISQQEFDRVQRLVHERRASPARAANGYYPFSQILKCPNCGSGMHANVTYKKEVPPHLRHHYACRVHRENPKACPKTKYINAYPVAYAVIPLAAHIVRDSAKLIESLTLVAKEYSKNETLQALEAETRAEMERSEQGIRRILDSIADGLVSRQEAKDKLEELREKRERLARDIQGFEEKESVRAELQEAISILHDDLDSVLWNLFKANPRTLGRILRLIFKPHSVVVQAYGEMEVRKGRVIEYEVNEGFDNVDVVPEHLAVRSLKGYAVRLPPLRARA